MRVTIERQTGKNILINSEAKNINIEQNTKSVVINSSRGPRGLTGLGIEDVQPILTALQQKSGNYGFVFHQGNEIQNIDSTRIPLKMNSQGSNINRLQTPFVNHDFFDLGTSGGVVIKPFSLFDYYFMTIRCDVVPSVVDAVFTIELDIGGTFGVIEKEASIIRTQAGEIDQITLDFKFFAGSTFLLNGGNLYVSSTFPAQISSTDIRIFPGSTE